eukprot:scaffold14230_cov20-Prasinocladus_malaysianus.AAC.1
MAYDKNAAMSYKVGTLAGGIVKPCGVIHMQSLFYFRLFDRMLLPDKKLAGGNSPEQKTNLHFELVRIMVSLGCSIFLLVGDGGLLALAGSQQ